jgi:CBS domain-containing protein
VRVLREWIIRALPVLDEKELVGIVTPYDLMQYAFNDVSISE